MLIALHYTVPYSLGPYEMIILSGCLKNIWSVHEFFRKILFIVLNDQTPQIINL